MSANLERVMAEEAEQAKEACLWMSFCDSNKPKGKQFLGVVITRTLGIGHAVARTWELGINPGGQVLSCELVGADIKPEHFDKLLTKEDLVAAGYA